MMVSTWMDVAHTRSHDFNALKSLLDARTEQITHEFNSIHEGYLTATSRVARFSDVVQACLAAGRTAESVQRTTQILKIFPESDPNIRGAALIDGRGRVIASSDDSTVDADLGGYSAVRGALAGESRIYGIYVSPTNSGAVPSVAYLVPVKDAAGRTICATALWVRAQPFRAVIKSSSGLAGAGSYAVLFDAQGIRIAHSLDDSNLYHPAGELPPEELNQAVREARFGTRTRELLEDVLPFPDQFARSRSASPDHAWFEGLSPSNGLQNYGVARRLSAVPWTIFYMVPQQVVEAQAAQVAREKILLSLAIVTIVAMAAALFATGLIGPLRDLRNATLRLASDPGARAPVKQGDELGELAEAFNTMADRIQTQESALREANAALERRVQERTAELDMTVIRLQQEGERLVDAQDMVRENERLLHAIIDNTAAVIYVKDLDGRFVLVNERFLQVFRLERDQVIGKTDFDIVPAEAAVVIRQIDEEVARSPQPVLREESIPQDDGEHTYISVKSPLRDDEGLVTGVFGVSTDITERKRLESRQRAQLERLNLLDQITQRIGEREDLGSLYHTLCNTLEERFSLGLACVCHLSDEPGMLEVMTVGQLGQARAQAMGLATGSRLPIGDNGLSRCIGGQLVYEPELTRNAHEFPRRLAGAGFGSVVLSPLMSDSRVFGMLITARDATEGFGSNDCEFLRQLSSHVALASVHTRLYTDLRRAYEELRMTQQAVLQQERLSALGQMASGIAHDINNAISPVSVYVESLLETERGLSERARSQLQIIARSVDDVAATVARMREFYRTDTEDARAAVDLSETMRQVAELTRARWSDQALQAGQSIVLHTEVAGDTPPALAVATEVREALVNLVLNAVDAMPHGGSLRLRCGAQEHSRGHAGAYVEVIDSGIGMDEETRRRCLEPFFTTKGQRGTGLGLAMVYGIAQRNEADIEIRSAPGQGTTVRLVFAAAGTDLPAPSPAEQVRHARVLRILVIDDDPLLQQSIAALLEVDEHEAMCAGSGPEGIAHLQESLAPDGRNFDAVITDLGMPGMGGYEVAAAAKQLAPALPVILLTGWGQRLIDDGTLPPNVDRVLNKPPKLAILRGALADLVPDRKGDVDA
ncbi:PAS domain-containing protein [Variovorax sp. VNK109]|uniref:PAS domain-containing protein n=1 Tax=Variovorax sp. VNK109 TaxID=3400919 RepID=UPI003C115789